jgi:ATP-dependent Clp endopeptidase proteolytic subunit ClpP
VARPKKPITPIAPPPIQQGRDRILPHNPKRSILLFGEVNTDMTKQLAEQIAVLLKEDDKSPICVVVNTEGGGVYESFAMHDLIRACSVPIYTYGLGTVMSAGTIMLAAGKKRYAYPNCWIMAHEPWFVGSELRAGELKADLMHNEKLSMVFYGLYSRYCQKPADIIENDLNGRTIYFNAIEAKKYGFVDDIVDID